MRLLDIACPIIVIVGTLLLGQFGLRYLYGYRLKENELQIVFCGLFLIRRIQFTDIEDVRKYRFTINTLFHRGENAFLFGEKWGNRLFGDVLVITKRGITRHITITPDNSDEFLAAIQEKLDNVDRM